MPRMIWTLNNATMTLAPFGGEVPKVFVAGGGRARTIAGEHADGWITMQPFGSTRRHKRLGRLPSPR